MRGAGVTLSEGEFWAVLKDTPPVATAGATTPFEDRLIRVCAKASLSISLTVAAELAHAVCCYSNSVTVLDPEAVGAVGAARLFGPVTNYDHPPSIHHLLERERLREHFSVVVISGEVGVWKPDPSILLGALARLRVQPHEAVYVGDSDVDILAANAAQMRSILIRRRSGPSDPFRDPYAEERDAQPTTVIESLGELSQAVTRLDLYGD